MTGGTVIVVDDDLPVLRSLTRLLTASNYDVEAFAAAADVLALTAFPSPCCFVIDLNMPGTNGFDLLEALREKMPGVQAILISGDADAARMARAQSAGALACLPKPFDADEFLAVVDRAIVRAGASASTS